MPIARIQNMIANGGNCVNLGRTMQARHPDLHNYVMSRTTWLDHKKPKFNERVWCIMNNITSTVMTADNRPAIFDNIFNGYSTRDKFAQRSQIAISKQAARDDRAAESVKHAQALVDTHMEWAKMVCSDDMEVGRKLYDHVQSWSTNSGKALYSDPSLVEGEDYVVCPITKLRKVMIRSNYVTNVLAMTMEEYSAIVGPDFVYTAPNHSITLSDSLKVIDEESGLTKNQIASIKAQATLNEVDPETGLTGHELRIAKTVNTHKTKIDEHGLNGYQRLAKKAIIKGNKTKQARGLITLDEERPDYKLYMRFVHYVTRKSTHLLDTSASGRAGTPGATHLDHKFSIMKGFKEKVSPMVLGNFHNLEVLPWATNVSKSAKCSIELHELLKLTQYTQEQSQLEFDIFQRLIDEPGDHKLSAGIMMEKLIDETKISRQSEVRHTDT